MILPFGKVACQVSEPQVTIQSEVLVLAEPPALRTLLAVWELEVFSVENAGPQIHRFAVYDVAVGPPTEGCVPPGGRDQRRSQRRRRPACDDDRARMPIALLVGDTSIQAWTAMDSAAPACTARIG